MTKKKIILLIAVLIGIEIILGWINFEKKKQIQELFQNSSKTVWKNKIISNQIEINQKLEQKKKSQEYTLDHAYIELNPYQISPLSAIIIFQSNSEEEIEVWVNNIYYTKTEQETQHAIPIYGLYENKDNVIKLISSTNSKEYHLTTEPSNLSPLQILEKKETLDKNQLYFMTSSHESGLTGWDNEGNLRFYLTETFRMDVEWLDNGHFIIGIPEGHFAENFYGFVEMDYLGKIYNYYTLEYGFSFESQILSNGNYMTSGGNPPVYIKEQMITEINPKNGETINTINVYEIIKKVDESFPDTYLGQAAIRNGFYYNEQTKELIVSFRGINSILSINYETKELNWVFTNPDNELFQNEVWKDYLITSIDNHYPWGQHSPIITKDGYIGFFNNGYDRYHGFEVGGNDFVNSYQNNYSQAELYEIKNKTATRIWFFDGNKELFSHQYGSFTITNQQSKLINFGWTLKSDYRNNPNATLSNSEKNIENTYAYIIELDEQNNILFQATCEEGKYRVFKHTMDASNQIDFSNLAVYQNIKKEDILRSKIKIKELKEAPSWIYDLTITSNTLQTNYDIKEDDDVKLYFLNQLGTIYEMTYKPKEQETKNRIFYLDLPKEEYLIYIKINDNLYQTNTKLNFN